MAQGAEKTLRQMFGAYGPWVIGVLASLLLGVITWWANEVHSTVKRTAETLGTLTAQITPGLAAIDHRLGQIEGRMEKIEGEVAAVDDRLDRFGERAATVEAQINRIADAVLPLATATRTETLTPTRTVTSEPSATPAGIEETQENPTPAVRPQYLPNTPRRRRK